MEMQNAKGTRDILPEEQIVKSRVVDTLRRSFELFGFNPLDTPILERFDILSSKYAGGSEILKETFKLNDQGDRDLCLRYDLTVPLARFIAMNPNVKLPFKRYQIGDVFRDGPIKAGRFREFMQCDADVIGPKELLYDAELLALASKVFEELRMPITIKFNSRKILDAAMSEAGVAEDKRADAILSIDKLEKIGKDDVIKELESKGIPNRAANRIFSLLEAKQISADTLEYLRAELKSEQGKLAIEEIAKFSEYIDAFGADAVFTPSLARGLAYYTGTIFEVFLKDSEITASVAAGGRYDEMIGNFVGGKQAYPAVGISFGVDVILEAIKRKQKATVKSVVKVLVIPIKTEKKCIELVTQLRTKGIACELSSEKKGVSKGLEYASSYGIPFAVFVGDEELKQGKYKLRDMKTGTEEMLDLNAVVSKTA